MIHLDADFSSEEMVFEEGIHELKFEFEETQFMLTPSIKKVRTGHENLDYNAVT